VPCFSSNKIKKERIKMKFVTFSMYDVAKTAEMMQVADKNSKIPGQKMLAGYIFLGKPFDGMPPNKGVGMSIREVESAEALAAVLYNMTLIGATAWAVPVLEGQVGSSEADFKKFQK
jgi:hypothetical protein